MKQQFNHLLKILVLIQMIVLLIVPNFIHAQQNTATNTLLQPMTSATGDFGPTLIIASSLPYNDNTYDYMHSKLYYYPVYHSDYKFVLVNYSSSNLLTQNNGHENSNASIALNYSQVHQNYNDNINSILPRFQYLNDAIISALAAGFRRIIILEGEYQVDNPIIINNIGGATGNYKASGKITIEGEGYGTRIVNAPTYLSGPIFDIRSSYNTLKNMSIISDTYNIGTIAAPTYAVGKNTCINITANAGSGNIIRNNIFENLYLGAGGNNYMASSVPPPNVLQVADPIYDNTQSPPAIVGYTLKSDANPLDATGIVNKIGININAVDDRVENNKFRNITFNSFDKGMVIAGTLNDPATPVNESQRVNDNIFENFNFDNVIVGIDFANGVYAYDNVFNNMSLQTDNYTTNFVRKISGTKNIFRNLNNSDWNAGNGGNGGTGSAYIKYITLSATSSHTTIADSEMAFTDKYYEEDALASSTQFINNSVLGNTSNRIGISNSSNTALISTTEILGKLKLTANDYTTNASTIATGRVLTSDANGYATWQNPASNAAWSHAASKNISLNNYAITNNNTSATLPNNASGIRLDNNGNVRIGTAAPFTTNPAKLQVDGRAIIGNASQAMNDYDATYKLIVNGKVRVREEVYVKQGSDLNWPDYVFAKNYNLMPLPQVEKYIQEKGYLPNMPSAAEVEKDGIAVGDLIKRQQEKIEELTLYLIEMKKEIEALKQPKK